MEPVNEIMEPPVVGWRRWAWVDSEGRLSIMKPNATHEEVAELGEPDERLIRVQITEVTPRPASSVDEATKRGIDAAFGLLREVTLRGGDRSSDEANYRAAKHELVKAVAAPLHQEIARLRAELAALKEQQ